MWLGPRQENALKHAGFSHCSSVRSRNQLQMLLVLHKDNVLASPYQSTLCDDSINLQNGNMSDTGNSARQSCMIALQQNCLQLSTVVAMF